MIDKIFVEGRMARIGEAELERLKAQVAVADLVAASGVLLAFPAAESTLLGPALTRFSLQPVKTFAKSY